MNDHRTPAQLAGLIPTHKSESERLLEEIATTVRGPDGLTFMQRREAQRLARRRELLAEAAAETDRIATAAEDHEKKRQKILQELEAAERAWWRAQEKARGLPLWAPDSARIGEIHRELIETCDPRLRDLGDWLSREQDVTRAHGPPFELVDIVKPFDGSAARAGFNQEILRALEKRLAAIQDALAATRAAMLEALTEAELVSKIAEILALVPPLPAGASQTGPTPMPLTIDGRPPAQIPAERERRIAAVGEQHKRAAKSDGRARR